MAQDKLQALLLLRDAVDTDVRRRALHDRIVKAYLSCASALIEKRQTAAGLARFASALKIPGSPVRKAKGLARTIFNVIKSV